MPSLVSLEMGDRLLVYGHCMWSATQANSAFYLQQQHPFNRLPRWAGTRKVNQGGFYWSKRQWVAVASAGPYASLHLALDRYPHQHPTAQFFTGRMPFLAPNQQCQSTGGKLSTISRMENEYCPKCVDALRLGVKAGVAYSACGLNVWVCRAWVP